MSISDVIRTRYASKAYDDSRKLSPEQEQQILDLLRFSPSSVNSQPWHFFAITSDEAKQSLVSSVSEPNAAKILKSSMVIVFTTQRSMGDEHLNTLLAQEKSDGRFANDEAQANQDKGRRFFFGLNSDSEQKQREWMARQAYLSLGFLLLGAASMGLDATPIEGFTAASIDNVLGLKEKNLTSVVMATVGYHHDSDFNAKLPKSRLPETSVITRL